MGEMDFEKSTQAKHWMFDEASLLECREKACRSQDGKRNLKARKFACGYASKSDSANNVVHSMHTGFNMSANDQDILVHFHAHQIQRLIGPNAIFPQLRRGASVLSTAIMLFRRFYLSNSAVDFHPRNIAAASALLSVKADCEERIPVSSKPRWIYIYFALNVVLPSLAVGFKKLPKIVNSFWIGWVDFGSWCMYFCRALCIIWHATLKVRWQPDQLPFRLVNYAEENSPPRDNNDELGHGKIPKKGVNECARVFSNFLASSSSDTHPAIDNIPSSTIVTFFCPCYVRLMFCPMLLGWFK